MVSKYHCQCSLKQKCLERFVARRPNCSLMLAGETFRRPSVFLLPPVEQVQSRMVTLTCYVTDFYPKQIVVTWLIDDKPAEVDTFSTTIPVEHKGSYSAYGQLSLSRDDWLRNDVVYNCVVYHESILDTNGVIMRSMIERSCEKTNLVNLNMNIPQTCMAQ